MNSILDQQEYQNSLDEEDCVTIALIAKYIRTWKDTDGELHYELTEKGVKRLAHLMVN